MQSEFRLKKIQKLDSVPLEIVQIHSHGAIPTCIVYYKRLDIQKDVLQNCRSQFLIRKLLVRNALSYEYNNTHNQKLLH